MKSAGAVVFTIKDNEVRYLLLKHIKTGTHWGFPKGRMENGESEKEAATREISEETGLTNLTFIDGFIDKEEYSFKRKDDGVIIDKVVTYFLAEVNSKDTRISEEHTEYIWVAFDEAMEKLNKKEMNKVLIAANQLLSKHFSSILGGGI